MTPVPIRFALLLALCAAGADAREVYKCITPAGAVAYQDRPCPAGSEEALLRITEAVDDTSPGEPASSAPAAAAEPVAAREPLRSRKPLPAIWLCTNAENGAQYVSRNGPPPPRAVPLGVLGYPGKSLAQAYGPGSNVMSAPELSKSPIDRSPQSALATSYTQLQDACRPATAAQTCDYLRQQLDAAADTLSHARFKDEQAKAQAQVDGLLDDLSGC